MTVEEVPVPGSALSVLVWRMPADDVRQDGPKEQQALAERACNGPSTDRLLAVKEVVARTGLSRASIYRLERAGGFPKRLSISKNRVAWKESEIGAWIAQPKMRRS
jgi:prophage regulatory protein